MFILLFAEKEHSVKTKIIVADFSKGAEVYPHIEAELKDIPVGILGILHGLNITLYIYIESYWLHKALLHTH